jgi:hypothetical protein
LVAFATTVVTRPSARLYNHYDCVRTTDPDDAFEVTINEQCELCETQNEAKNWCFIGVAKEMDEAQEECFTGLAREMDKLSSNDESLDKMSVLLTEVTQGNKGLAHTTKSVG